MATIPDDVKERVLSYIAHQSVKEPAEIAAIVQQGHDQVLAALEGLTEEQAAFKPGPDDWSVLQVLQHAAEGEQRVARRCAALAAGQATEPISRTGLIGPEPFTSLAQARAAIAAAHAELLDFVASLSPETNTDTKLEHPFFGSINCREWAVFQRVHDGDHANQIGQIKAAPGFPGR
jgi:hypothetical protein